MRTRITLPLVIAAVLAPRSGLRAQPDLLESLKDTGIGAHWIYNDLKAGFDQAKATGKPLLALFRCVP